jgi:hypothetical protein
VRFSVNIDRDRWLRGSARDRRRIINARKDSALAVATAIFDKAKETVPKDENHLSESISMVPTRNGAKVIVTAEHARFSEFGTGIYSSNGTGRKTPWVYKHRKWGWVVTRGQRAQHWFRSATEFGELASTQILRGVWSRRRF